MKKATTILSVVQVTIILIPAGSIPESQPHIHSSGPVNKDNSINDNSIDIDDFAFNVDNNSESAKDNRNDKPQMNKYYSPTEKTKSLLSQLIIRYIISRSAYIITLRKLK